MRRVIVVMSVILFVACGFTSVFAKEQKKDSSQESKMQGGMMKGQDMAGCSKMKKKGNMGGEGMMARQMMMNKSMIETKDGGIVILAGNKLIKYDKKLNLVKEVEINIGCNMDMQKMMKNCPAYQQKSGMKEEAQGE